MVIAPALEIAQIAVQALVLQIVQAIVTIHATLVAKEPVVVNVKDNVKVAIILVVVAVIIVVQVVAMNAPVVNLVRQVVQTLVPVDAHGLVVAAS